VGEPDYGFLIQTETGVDVIATTFAFHNINLLFQVYACHLQLIIDYFSYHSLLQNDMI
jgi:hypothetical protein